MPEMPKNVLVSLDLDLGRALKGTGNGFRFLPTRLEKVMGEL